MADELFDPYAQRLLACWCAQLAVLPAADRPARCSMRFDADDPTMGMALFEDECKCGTAWVRVVDWYVTSDDTFPGPDPSLEAQRCPALWALVLEMGIGRCPPAGDERKLATEAELNAFHLIVMQDGKAMRQAIYCCFLTVDAMDVVSIGQPRRIGPQGKCFQQSLQLTVMVTACSEC